MSRIRLPLSGLLFVAWFRNGENGDMFLSCFLKVVPDSRPLDKDLITSGWRLLPFSPKLYLSVSCEKTLDLFLAEVDELFK